MRRSRVQSFVTHLLPLPVLLASVDVPLLAGEPLPVLLAEDDIPLLECVIRGTGHPGEEQQIQVGGRRQQTGRSPGRAHFPPATPGQGQADPVTPDAMVQR